MTAYWISTYLAIHDEQRLAAYAELAGPALSAAGGTFLARGMPAAHYEQGRDMRTVVIAFESVEAAMAAHDSADYTAALEALGDGVDRDLRIIPGA